MSAIEKLNKDLLEIHNILSGREEISEIKLPLSRQLIHEAGTQGLIVHNETVNPDDYYSLLDND